MKDLYNHIEFVQAIKPVLVLDNIVPAAATVDLAGFNSAVIEVSCGAKGAGDTGTITLKVEHVDDDGTGSSGTYASVEEKDMLGVTPASGVILTLVGGAVAAKTYKFGYVGEKRFIKLTLAEADSNATGTIMGINVIKGHLGNSPPLR